MHSSIGQCDIIAINSNKSWANNQNEELSIEGYYKIKNYQISMNRKVINHREDTILGISFYEILKSKFYLALNGQVIPDQDNIHPRQTYEIGNYFTYPNKLYSDLSIKLTKYPNIESHFIQLTTYNEESNNYQAITVGIAKNKIKQLDSNKISYLLKLSLKSKLSEKYFISSSIAQGTETHQNEVNHTGELVNVAIFSLKLEKYLVKNMPIHTQYIFEKHSKIDRKSHTLGLGINWEIQ